ncbi:hypothetical protein QT971_04890 [Microcoleus sp. herbarium19]|uniref:hypothetical protein n=1 Tax=unclassified Microcoleus TaxID=2642155 RepID=UPI002FD6FB10
MPTAEQLTNIVYFKTIWLGLHQQGRSVEPAVVWVLNCRGFLGRSKQQIDFLVGRLLKPAAIVLRSRPNRWENHFFLEQSEKAAIGKGD